MLYGNFYKYQYTFDTSINYCACPYPFYGYKCEMNSKEDKTRYTDDDILMSNLFYK